MNKITKVGFQFSGYLFFIETSKEKKNEDGI